MDLPIKSRAIPDEAIAAFLRWRKRSVAVGDPSECWVARKCRSYPMVKGFGAHRLAYSEAHGPIPDGLVVGHKCDNPRCVNPHHLEAITCGQNVRDARDRGLITYERGEDRYNAIMDANTAQKIADLHRSQNWGRVRIARALNLPPNAVKKVLEGRTWTEVTGFGSRYRKPAVPYTTRVNRRKRAEQLVLPAQEPAQ